MGRAKKYSTPEEAREVNNERSKKYMQDNYEQHREKQREKQREIYRQKHPGSKIYKKHPPKILNDLSTNINNLPKSSDES